MKIAYKKTKKMRKNLIFFVYVMTKYIDFCHDISYNIITVKEDLTSKAGKKPERSKRWKKK